MAINLLPAPRVPPVAAEDWTRMSNMLAAIILGNEISLRVVGTNVVKGAVFQVGGALYAADSNTAISGTPSEYVKLTPSGDGSTLSASFVVSLVAAGVAWNSTWNGWYDGESPDCLYIFDEGKAFTAEQIPAIMKNRDVTVPMGTGWLAALAVNMAGGWSTAFSAALGANWATALAAVLGTNWATALAAALGASWTTALGAALGAGWTTALAGGAQSIGPLKVKASLPGGVASYTEDEIYGFVSVTLPEVSQSYIVRGECVIGGATKSLALVSFSNSPAQAAFLLSDGTMLICQDGDSTPISGFWMVL